MNRPFLRRSLSVIAHQPLGGTTRFRARLPLHLNQKNGVDEARRFVGRKQSYVSANRRARAQCRGKADLIHPVIDGHLNAGANLNCFPEKVRQQRKSQKAVSNRTPERRFALGTLRVEMNPLVIRSSVSKSLDPVLRDDKPIGGGKFASFTPLEGIQIVNLKRWHGSFS